jgi:hypothetical protein
VRGSPLPFLHNPGTACTVRRHNAALSLLEGIPILAAKAASALGNPDTKTKIELESLCSSTTSFFICWV